MAKYRKKPVAIEAVQWTGHNVAEMCKFTNKDVSHLISNGQLYIETLEGFMRANIGDYIIKGVRGEFYPCKPDIFCETYDKVSEEQPIIDPVKHGKWIGLEYDGYADGYPVWEKWECSECGNEIYTDEPPAYCCDCGARMDGE